MPRTYYGLPGDPLMVAVEDESGTRPLDQWLVGGKEAVPFDWGDLKPSIPMIKENMPDPRGCASLAFSLTVDILGGDREEAARIYGRVRYRTVALWARGQPWKLSGADLVMIVDDIRRTERETAQMRRMVAQEPMPIAHGAGGPGKWTKAADDKGNQITVTENMGR